MRKLYSYFVDCGRMGNLEGLFIADDAEVKESIGKEVYFGEVLGKHSEVSGVLEEGELTVVSEDQNKIEWLSELLGDNLSGFNPLDYIQDDEEY